MSILYASFGSVLLYLVYNFIGHITLLFVRQLLAQLTDHCCLLLMKTL